MDGKSHTHHGALKHSFLNTTQGDDVFVWLTLSSFTVYYSTNLTGHQLEMM